MEVGFDRKSLIISGERRFIFSGSIHYYRLPGKDMWRARLRKLKELGMNAADIYFYWGYHSPREGEYDFTGERDVDELMNLVEDEGLYLIARPGPYICSEVDCGGFPAWLVSKRYLAMRCRRKGKFVYDEEYMGYVRQWYEQIVPKIARRRNLILFQVENEYHLLPTPRGMVAGALKILQRRFGPNVLLNLSHNPFVQKVMLARLKGAFRSRGYRRSNRYMQELYNMARELGVKVPIFHNDVVEAGVRFTDVDILAIDDYPIKAYDRDWRGGVNPFANIDTFEQGHEAHGVNCPLFVAETQGGWYDLWGRKGYDDIRSFLGPDSLDITMKSCLAQGASILNLFMACGGTSFGYISSPDVYTSYDMAAPVSEGCSFSARGRAAKAFSEFVFRNEQDILSADPDGSISVDDRNIFCKARKSVSGKRFVFLRNLTGKDREARIKPGGSTVSIPPSSMTVLMLDEKGGIQDERRPYLEAGERRLPSFELPRLERFSFAMISPQIDPDFDDSDWIDVPAANRLDMDALGLHFGFAWYRAELEKMVSSITIDARHCFAAYLNGHLLAARDNHGNRLAAGSDFAETVEIVPLQEHWRTGRNVLVILVESLGHNKGFLEDLHNPRGLVRVETQEGAIKRWKVRGGLVPGERGMTPRVDFDSLELDTEDVTLPHQWPLEQNGVGLYQTRFQLDLQKPDQPAIGFRVKSAPEKANIYLNGHLTGRYWESVGPQKLFYLPTAWLNQKGENHLAIAVWRWEDPSGLGEVNLEPYP